MARPHPLSRARTSLRRLFGVPALVIAPLAAIAFGCGSPALFHYPPGDAGSHMEGMGTKKQGSLEPGEMRFRPDTCKDYDLHPDYTVLDEQALMTFLNKQGFKTRAERARNDLVYLDVLVDGADVPIRLRIAILKTPADAGRELHEAILQHGPGSWGVHRSNLAVLAPIGETDEVLAFALKTHLACWGVMTMAGRDDSFVVPGAYIEL